MSFTLTKCAGVQSVQNHSARGIFARVQNGCAILSLSYGERERVFAHTIWLARVTWV